MIQAGIVGSSGYVAGELLRCLVNHPEVNINFLYSHSQHGQKAVDLHGDLIGYDYLTLTNEINSQVDVLFLCLGHGNSVKFLSENTFSNKTRIIDLSNDFRLHADAAFQDKNFVYGLTELNKPQIQAAMYIANPGCFATAIQLGLLPMAGHQLLKGEVHINAITGSTGAGQSPGATTHFSWRNNNVSIYKAFDHQHLAEIKESLISLQKDSPGQLNFLPVRGNFTRGIFATMYTKSDLSQEDLTKLYEDYYKEEVFTHITTNEVHLKQVVNTNHCLISVQKIEDKVLVTSTIDNLLKGAAGQAIQNMNLMFELDETTGLNFKASYF